jgi:hypothetical protein
MYLCIPMMTRRLMSIPFTKAYVKATAKHQDRNADDWIGDPRDVEKTFVDGHKKGISINDDYLNEFEESMRILLDKIDASMGDINRPRYDTTFYITTQIFHIEMRSAVQNFTIVLNEIYLRPCAEGRGFFRLILFRIACICACYKCDMFVQNPLQPTMKVLKRAFGDVLERVESTNIREHNLEAKLLPNYLFTTDNQIKFMVIRFEHLMSMTVKQIASRLGIIKDMEVFNPNEDLILHSNALMRNVQVTSPQVEYYLSFWLNKAYPYFPSANEMNVGPPLPAGSHSSHQMVTRQRLSLQEKEKQRPQSLV